MLEIIKSNLSEGNLHSSTIRKFYEDFPEVKEYAQNELKKCPKLQSIGYFAILTVKNLELQKCPNCGKLMDYERTYKNNKKFCSRKCFNEDKTKKNGTYGKERKSHYGSSNSNYSNTIKFEEINKKILHNLFSNKSSRYIVQLYRKSEQVRKIAGEEYKNNNNYLTPCNALICICHDIKLPRCGVCGKEMKYQTHKNRQSLYCSKECAKNSSTYVEKQRKCRYELFYNNTVKFAKEKNCELLTPKNEYKGAQNNNRFRCLICNREFSIEFSYNIKRDLKCPYCKHVSSFENEIKKFILENNIEIITNSKSFLKNNYEIDIIIPENKLCIECNGIYWHSLTRGKNENYHLSKTLECEEKGYKLLHIFEDDWKYRKKAVKGIIKDLLNKNNITISHEKCTVKKLALNKAEKFIRKYSLLLDYKNKLSYGIFYKNKLIAVIVTENNKILDICKIYNLKIKGLEKIIKNNFSNYFLLIDNRIPNRYMIDIIEKLPPRKFYVGGARRFINKPNRKTIYEIYDCGYSLASLL